MPRYFFHFTDGKRQFSDTSGHDLSGMQAVRAQAMRQVRELKAAMSDPIVQDLTNWSMTVVDASGKPVFALGFDLKPRLDRA